MLDSFVFHFCKLLPYLIILLLTLYTYLVHIKEKPSRPFFKFRFYSKTGFCKKSNNHKKIFVRIALLASLLVAYRTLSETYDVWSKNDHYFLISALRMFGFRIFFSVMLLHMSFIYICTCWQYQPFWIANLFLIRWKVSRVLVILTVKCNTLSVEKIYATT